MNGTRICVFPGCTREGKSRRICNTHYSIAAREGYLDSFPTITLDDRFNEGTVRAANGCLEWAKYRNSDGYGRIHAFGKQMSTHRAAWMMTHGEIPEGLEVCHRCDNPPCCDVDHLFLGTHVENIADRDKKGRCRSGSINSHNANKPTCKRGHEYSVENTIVRESGGRICRTCERWRASAKQKGIPISEYVEARGL